MKIKRRDLISLFNSLSELKKQMTGKVISFYVVKNIKILETEIEAIKTVVSPSQKRMEFENKKREILEKYCNRDENGNPIKTDNGYVFKSELQEILIKEFKDLDNQYEDIIKEIKDIEEFMNQDVEVELNEINLEHLPETVSGELIEGLFSILKE